MTAPDPAFESPWHAQVFALTVYLNEAGHFAWPDWAQRFGATLARHGLADIIRPTVHHGTLQTTLEGFIAAGNELPEKIFNQYEQTVIRFNGRSRFLTDQNHEKTRMDTN